MNWKTKARIQQIASHLPGGDLFYEWGQRFCGGLRNFNIRPKLQAGLNILGALKEAGVDISGKRTAEIGTGWAPVIPVLFWLKGQAYCETYDIRRHLKKNLLREAFHQFLEWREQIDGVTDPVESRRRDWLKNQLTEGIDVMRILAECGIGYHAPVNALSGPLPGQVDIVFTNSVLEHLTRDELTRLFQTCGRMKRGLVMAHLVDLGDHFSHADPSITSVNFLKYSPEAFERYNSRFIYQNRLREPEWRGLVEEHGFECLAWKSDVNQRALAGLSRLPVHAVFRQFKPEELCVSSLLMILRKI